MTRHRKKYWIIAHKSTAMELRVVIATGPHRSYRDTDRSRHGLRNALVLVSCTHVYSLSGIGVNGICCMFEKI